MKSPTDQRDVRYEDFLRLERGIEANKKHLRNMKNGAAAYTEEDERSYLQVIKIQELSLLQCRRMLTLGRDAE